MGIVALWRNDWLFLGYTCMSLTICSQKPPVRRSDGVSWEISLEKKERDQSGTFRRPRRVGIPYEKVIPHLILIPFIDTQPWHFSLLVFSFSICKRRRFRFNVSLCCPMQQPLATSSYGALKMWLV